MKEKRIRFLLVAFVIATATVATTNSKFISTIFIGNDSAKAATYQVDIQSNPDLVDRNVTSENYTNHLTVDEGKDYKLITFTVTYKSETRLKFFVGHVNASENEDDSDTTVFEITDEAGNKQEDMPNGYWEFEPAHEQITRVFTAKLTQADGKNVSYVTLVPRVEQIGG